jgi:adenine-specific DNA-methyltransferase
MAIQSTRPTTNGSLSKNGDITISDHFDPTADFILFPGDCLDLLANIPDKHVNLVVTSPPYNVGKAYENRVNFATYLDQQSAVIAECVRVLDDAGSLC